MKSWPSSLWWIPFNPAVWLNNAGVNSAHSNKQLNAKMRNETSTFLRYAMEQGVVSRIVSNTHSTTKLRTPIPHKDWEECLTNDIRLLQKYFMQRLPLITSPWGT